MPRSRKRRPKTGGQTPAPSLRSAVTAFERRDFATAVDMCRRVIARDPANIDALNILGGAHLELGDTPAAIDVLMRAQSLWPHDATIEANLGSVLATAKRFDEAEKHLSHALSLTPHDTDVMANLGYAQFELGQFDRAMEIFAAALALSPDNVNILIGAIRAAASGGDMASAGQYARLALALDVQDSSTQRELTRVMYEYHQYPESLTAAEAALAKNSASAGLHIDKGVVLSRLERHDEALVCFDAALRHEPDNADAVMWRTMLNLALGRFSDGWPGYLARPTMRSLQVPNSMAACGKGYHRQILPADMSGATVLVERDQGLGDELFFLRFAKKLRNRGAHVTYRSDERLVAMLRRADVADEVVCDPGPRNPCDFAVTVCDLPWLVGAGDDDSVIPSISLVPLAGKTAEMATRLQAFGGGPYVGVTWRGGTIGNNKFLYKEVPAERLAHAVAGVRGSIIVLQRNPAEGEVEAFAKAAGRQVLDLSHLNADLEAMLSLCSLLDSYVSVSNNNVHLREACGRPSDVIVPYPPEFRWMASGAESPWFPGTMLYRQTPDTDWEPALRQLTAALSAGDPHLRAAG